MYEIIVLSITQGITEFLPVSSSAHLILVSKLLNFNNENLIFDVSLHFGSLIAVLFFFKKEIFNFFQNKNLFIKVIIGSAPTLAVGFFLAKLELIEVLRNNYIIAFNTIFFAIVLYFSDLSHEKKDALKELTIKDIIYLGLLQCLSLIPGVSRSGITLTGARFLKFNRIKSAKISFLFSIPILSAASLYNIIKILEMKDLQITIQNFWAILLSFIFSTIALKFFINFLKKYSLKFFIIYRIILGILIYFYVFN